jgi:hypothetical protein
LQGKKYYLKREFDSVSSSGDKLAHAGDFCAAKLSLDKIVGWDAPVQNGDNQETTVSYTYKVEAADWTKNPAAQQVFPMVTKVIEGAGALQLKQRFRLSGNGWVPVNLWE